MATASVDYSKLIADADAKKQDATSLLLARKFKIDNDPAYAKYKGDALYERANAATGAATVSVQRNPLMDAKQLASMYGDINYNFDDIRNKFNDATRAEYDVKRKEYANTENTFYNNMYNTGVTAQDTLRKNTADAITRGAGRGVQAATELSALLGLQQAGVQGATDLAVQRNLLTDKEQAAMALNTRDALTTANETGLKLGTLGANIYAADTQFNVGQMSAQAQADLARKQLEAAGISADATKAAAQTTSQGYIDSAKATAAGNLASAQASAQGARGAAATAAAAYTPAAPAATLQGLIDDALAKGNRGVALALIMQATGADYATAQKILEGAGSATGSLPVTGPNSPVQGPSSNIQYTPGVTPSTGAQTVPTIIAAPTASTYDKKYATILESYIRQGLDMVTAQQRTEADLRDAGIKR